MVTDGKLDNSFEENLDSNDHHQLITERHYQHTIIFLINLHLCQKIVLYVIKLCLIVIKT